MIVMDWAKYSTNCRNSPFDRTTVSVLQKCLDRMQSINRYKSMEYMERM